MLSEGYSGKEESGYRGKEGAGAGAWRVRVVGAEADKAFFTEEVGRIWGGREDRNTGERKVINMNRGLDARMDDLSW